MSRVVVNEIEAKVGNDITFNDTVKISTAQIDTVRGKTTAGSVTIQGENTNTTNLQQGLAKAFLAYKGNTTNAIYDSNNVSSVSDDATGKHTPTFTNNFNGANDYATTGFGQQDTGGGGRIVCGISSPATSNRPVNTVNASNSNTDLEWLNLSFHGDLA
tara:strand:- start:45 stop:521 length:477 start_codon:yes stop_codon:yes gene_type:complete